MFESISWDNFKLGLAGIWDATTGSTSAATVYAEQTAESEHLDAAAEATLEKNATAAEVSENIVGKAWTKTKSDVGGDLTKWIAIAIAVYLAAKILPALLSRRK